MSEWNLKYLKEKIEEEQGVVAGRRVQSTIESLMDRQEYCRYYLDQFNIAYSKYIPKDTTQTEAFDYILNDDLNNTQASMHTACGANAIGYLQSAHSMLDTLSHVIYYALKMESTPSTSLIASRISFGNVSEKLIEFDDCNELVKQLQKLKSIDQFEYLSDFVNQVKHRMLVGTQMHIKLESDAERVHGLKFIKFEKDGRHHDSVYIDEWISKFQTEFFPLVVYVGIEINNVVESREDPDLIHHSP